MKIHDYYRSLIAERIGDTVGYQDQPEKYKYFIEVRKECEKLKVGYKFYIKAQFDGLEWAGTFPDPTQLVGLKALERLQKAAFAGNIKLGNEEREIDFTKIRKNGQRKRKNKNHPE